MPSKTTLERPEQIFRFALVRWRHQQSIDIWGQNGQQYFMSDQVVQQLVQAVVVERRGMSSLKELADSLRPLASLEWVLTYGDQLLAIVAEFRSKWVIPLMQKQLWDSMGTSNALVKPADSESAVFLFQDGRVHPNIDYIPPSLQDFE